ncbi:trypsin-like peptidase domain-containing protein [Candidatus Palauibacter sp.]|uniref:trypsin-like peptidase domain-containing protein n=1 Tax=Candidatus Palauibacter sp. TaxID=3101350 RepID=UPI003B5303B1
MRIFAFVGVFASVVSLIGCATGLTRAGSMIRESTDLSVRNRCEFIGTIDESERMGAGQGDNRRGALNRVRNRVAELGGDTFLIVSLDTDNSGAYVQAEVYGCGTVGSSASHAPATPAPSGREGSMTTGSGFYVSRSGHVLTNAHVVEQCREVRIPPTGTAEIVARDDASDLALLKNDIANQPIPAIFRGGRGVQPGAGVVVIGFPLQGIISSGPSVTTGIISSLAGPSNDRRLFQMTAPIHPGSSGGPVLDDAGNVVGVATAKLDPFVVARETGDIPQNISFAVSAGIARAFLDAEGVRYEILPSDPALPTENIATRARQFTLRIECRE